MENFLRTSTISYWFDMTTQQRGQIKGKVELWGNTHVQVFLGRTWNSLHSEFSFLDPSLLLLMHLFTCLMDQQKIYLLTPCKPHFLSHSLAKVDNSQILVAFIQDLVFRISSIVGVEGHWCDKLIIAHNHLPPSLDFIRRSLAKEKWGYFYKQY